MNDTAISYNKTIRRHAFAVLEDINSENFYYAEEPAPWIPLTKILSSENFDLERAKKGLKAFSAGEEYVQNSDMIDLGLGMFLY